MVRRYKIFESHLTTQKKEEKKEERERSREEGREGKEKNELLHSATHH